MIPVFLWLVLRLIVGCNMAKFVDSLRWIEISIGNANYQLTRAEDRHDLDTFNYWYAERERLYRERARLLGVSVSTSSCEDLCV